VDALRRLRILTFLNEHGHAELAARLAAMPGVELEKARDRADAIALAPGFDALLAPGEVCADIAAALAAAEAPAPALVTLGPSTAEADLVLEPGLAAGAPEAIARAIERKKDRLRAERAERRLGALVALHGRAPAELLAGLGQPLRALLGAEVAGLILGAEVHLAGASGALIAALSAGPVPGLPRAARASGALVASSELAVDPRAAGDPLLAAGMASGVAVPIPSAAPNGVLVAYFRARRVLAEDELALLFALAKIAGSANEQAALERREQRATERHRALSRIAKAIGSTLDVEGVFRIVGEQLQRVVPYQRLALKILKPGEAVFQVRTIERPGPYEPVRVRLLDPIPAGTDSPLTQALAERRSRVVERPHDPEVARRDSMFDAGVTRYAVVPIIADAPLGALSVGAGDDTALSATELELLEDLAGHMAIALKNGRMIADLETAYTDLKDTKDRLVRSERLQALGELAAGVAHDFNNLLAAVLGRAQMLKVMLADEAEEVLKSVAVIEQAALDGAGTVRRIQEFAKAKSDAHFMVVPLNALIRDTVERALTKVRANEHQAPIELSLELGDAGHVHGNPSDLRHVLTNLLYNAVDALDLGGRLTVRTGTDPAGALTWFEVEDTGRGMDEETLAKIFSPFFTTKGSRGTGLGLSVSLGIVERHKGEIGVWSVKGKGSRMRVQLPAHGSSTSGPPTEPARTHQTRAAFRDARILVIDDDAAVREVLADILRTGDHQVASAESGAEGLALFEAGKFDLVFTDLGMPGMNGWEVAGKIKELSPRTPVGLITGWGASLDEKRMKDLGVDLLVSKPFRYQQVLELVSEAMEFKSRLGG
jgi:signal transduction histidine kinase/ActR/RegA family two-component response regulator